MTLKNIFKNGGDKAFDRYHQGSMPHHGYYGPPPHPHSMPPHVFKHYSFSQTTNHNSKGGKGNGAAMSALTLLSFLFFLNILQQCLKEHMMAMNPQVTVMATGREELIPSKEDIESKKGEKLFLIEQPKSHGIGKVYPVHLRDDHFIYNNSPNESTGIITKSNDYRV